METAIPVLLVDGYNMCGYWPKLKKHFMKGRLDMARQKLIDELITFSVIKGELCTWLLTFDFVLLFAFVRELNQRVAILHWVVSLRTLLFTKQQLLVMSIRLQK